MSPCVFGAIRGPGGSVGGISQKKRYRRPGLTDVGAAQGSAGGRGPGWPPGGATTRMGAYWGGCAALALRRRASTPVTGALPRRSVTR